MLKLKIYVRNHDDAIKILEKDFKNFKLNR